MGSGSSRHLRAHQPRATKVNRFKGRRLASLICGSSAASTSKAASETEDHAVESMVNSAGYHHQVLHNSLIPAKEPSLCSGGGTDFSSTKAEPECSLPSTTVNSKEPLFDSSPQYAVSKRKYDAESSEFVSSIPHYEKSRFTNDNRASSSCSGEQSPGFMEANTFAPERIAGSADNETAETYPEVLFHSRLPTQEDVGILSSNEHTVEGQGRTVTAVHDATSVSSHGVSTPVIVHSPARDGYSTEEVGSSGLGLHALDTAQAHSEGGEVHVDLVSISSNGSSLSSDDQIRARESRRNSRRTFWNGFSSRSSRRRTEFPAILFSEEEGDGLRSPREWLFDIGGDFFDADTHDDPWPLSRRSHLTRDRRWHSRSEFLGRLRNSASERTRRNACPAGLHSDGLCSCPREEEMAYHTSISRIVMLAEALFEVLDEIHRLPGSFSLSVVSNPAPASVVDSLPLKSYSKSDRITSEEDNEQCYICLSEYENGDRIRVLPCNHEYHMACVDKWLKEIHGVCPLCRGNVGQGTQESSESHDPPRSSSVAQSEQPC